MPGLLTQGAPVEGPQSAQSTPFSVDPGSPEVLPEEVPNVSAAEQKQKDELVRNGMDMLANEKVGQQLLASIAGDGSPVEGLANAVVMLISRLEDSASEAGTKISGDILYAGGVELLEDMADMAGEVGIHDFTEEEMETAFFLALDTYRDQRQQQGKLPEKELKADFDKILAAEKDGTIEEMLPGIGEYAQRAPTPEQPPPGRGVA